MYPHQGWLKCHQCGEEGTRPLPTGDLEITAPLTLPTFVTGVMIGVVTFLITQSASSSLSASSTAGLQADAIGRAFQNRGWALSLIWTCVWIFFFVPKPSEKTLACLLKTSSKAGMVSLVSNWRKGQSRWINSNHCLTLILCYIYWKLLWLSMVLHSYISKPHDFYWLSRVSTQPQSGVLWKKITLVLHTPPRLWLRPQNPYLPCRP